MTATPAVHRGRHVSCTGCHEPILDVDEERVRIPITRTTDLGTSTQVLNFHRQSCFVRLLEALNEIEHEEQK